jgi:hypothetical protein
MPGVSRLPTSVVNDALTILSSALGGISADLFKAIISSMDFPS